MRHGLKHNLQDDGDITPQELQRLQRAIRQGDELTDSW